MGTDRAGAGCSVADEMRSEWQVVFLLAAAANRRAGDVLGIGGGQRQS